jgi:phosphoribosyl-AMP cyclohydrolase / phosphoribosyl-ATP pyrophosphohydrolase
MIENINFQKMNGLVPAIIQDAESGTVLMLGFMNVDALSRTMEEQQVTFWSRTKSRLWKKGETSGNYLDVVSINIDCDGDALLVEVRPRGPVCHTGHRSCFGKGGSSRGLPVIQKLFSIIQERKKKLPEGSYTAKLFRQGVARIGQKVGEEAVELAIAAQHQDSQRCVEESADLLYHLLVLLAEKEITLSQVSDELEKRMGG